MKNYFVILNNYIKDTHLVIEKIQKLTNIEVSDILGFEISDDVRYIYEHYSEFKLLWSDKNNKYVGAVDFVAYKQLREAHNKLVSLMYECYDIDEDKDKISQDIYNWYPLFWFPNGDSFCLDIRNGTVVFYEHELSSSANDAANNAKINKRYHDSYITTEVDGEVDSPVIGVYALEHPSIVTSEESNALKYAFERVIQDGVNSESNN